jgi:hypothetical protein
MRKLYLPLGGRHFWSRRAYELAYASPLGLVVPVSADEPVKDLSQRQRQVIDVLAEHGIDLRQKGEGFRLRRPRCKAPRSRFHALCPAE